MKRSLLIGVAAFALLAGTAGAADLKFKPGEDSRFNWASLEEFKKRSRPQGSDRSRSSDLARRGRGSVQERLCLFRRGDGVELKYSSSENYEQQIVIDTQAGSPPDVAILPQPGLIADLAAKGLSDGRSATKPSNGSSTIYAAGPSPGSTSPPITARRNAGALRVPVQDRRQSLVWYVRRTSRMPATKSRRPWKN